MSNYKEMVESISVSLREELSDLEQQEAVREWLVKVTECMKSHLLEPGAQERFERELGAQIVERMFTRL